MIKGKLKLPSRIGQIGLALAFIVIAAVAASAILPGSPSDFESDDGNQVVAAGSTNNDWATVDFIDVGDVFNSNADNSFTPGQKQDTTCPTTTGHKNPGKDDFTAAASFAETAANGDVYLYGATTRYAANGDAAENIELKRSDTLCAGQPLGGLTERTAGDFLIAIDYTQGGADVDIHVLTWVTSGACNVGSHSAPCWGANIITLADAAAEGAVNTVAIPANQNVVGTGALVAGQFAEFGINLTAGGIIPAGECEAFAQGVWESRSSGSSFVSSTKDIIIEDSPISNCATVEVTKTANDGEVQTGAVFTLYEGANTSGTVVGTCTIDAAGDCNPDFAGLQPGTYTIDETTVPAGYTKDADLPFTFVLDQGENEELAFENIRNIIGTDLKTQQSWFPNDTATVSAESGVLGPDGSVTFALFPNATCSGLATYSESVDVTGGTASEEVSTDNTTVAISTGYTDAANSSSGRYSWRVTYTPDATTDPFHTGVRSVCDAEHFDITYTNDAGPGTDLP